MCSKHGVLRICVPAAAVAGNQLAVKIDEVTGKAVIYPIETFRMLVEVNLIAPVYWAMEMVARIAEERKGRRGRGRWAPDEGDSGTAILIGSISSQGMHGSRVRRDQGRPRRRRGHPLQGSHVLWGPLAVIHPGYTDTQMVRALGQAYIEKNILPYTQLKRLIDPAEIADAIYFMICNWL